MPTCSCFSVEFGAGKNIYIGVHFVILNKTLLNKNTVVILCAMLVIQLPRQRGNLCSYIYELKENASKYFEYRISVTSFGTLLYMVKDEISKLKLWECISTEEKLAIILRPVLMSRNVIIYTIYELLLIHTSRKLSNKS